jgi:nucleoside-diphosphate-sugar epimerase
MKITVCGAGGYVGRRLSDYLENKGHEVTRWVREQGDLMLPECASAACEGAEMVFNLAANVGGIGFVSKEKASCLLSSVINSNLLQACVKHKVARYFFASSSCVYPSNLTETPEEAAYPADPSTEYGWEKLFSERLCQAFSSDYNLPTTVARLHGVYGPGDVRQPGRDHVIAALCKKVISAKLSGVHEISIWGDGEQTRSFLFIDDCVEGIWRLASQGISGPVNLANSQQVSVNDLVTLIEEISGVRLQRFYSTNAPIGCKHKVSSNAQLRQLLHWEPSTLLRVGLEATYNDFWDRSLK